MPRLTIALSADGARRLREAAERLGRRPEDISSEIVERALRAGGGVHGFAVPTMEMGDALFDAVREAHEAEDVQEHTQGAAVTGEPTESVEPLGSVREILAIAGLTWVSAIAEPRDAETAWTLDDMRRALTAAGEPMLSDIILEQRGSRE